MYSLGFLVLVYLSVGLYIFKLWAFSVCLFVWSHFLGPEAAVYVPSRFPWHLPVG